MLLGPCNRFKEDKFASVFIRVGQVRKSLRTLSECYQGHLLRNTNMRFLRRRQEIKKNLNDFKNALVLQCSLELHLHANSSAG